MATSTSGRCRGEGFEVRRKNYDAFLNHRLPIFDYKEADFEHFKNRYGNDDGRHLVEIFVAGPTVKEYIKVELESRELMRRSSAEENLPDNSPASWWQRIRINSWPVLGHLSRLIGHDVWQQSTSRVFFRPFNLLIYHQPNMKEALKELEERWGEIEKLDAMGDKDLAIAKEAKLRETMAEQNAKSTSEEDKYKQIPTDLDGIDALRHLRFYVEFVDKKLMLYKDIFNGISRKKIRFNDLTLLFKPGQLVYSPPSGSMSAMSERNYQTLWRVYYVGRTSYGESYPDDIDLTDSDKIVLYCYYIDYDGESYGLVSRQFEILAYEGEKNIADLNVYPLRYTRNSEAIRTNLIAQGDKFRSSVKNKHAYYEGWTIPSLTKDGENDRKSSNNLEHIDSNIILDFKEAFAHHRSWRPTFSAITTEVGSGLSGSDSFQLAHWSDRTRTQLLYSTNDIMQIRDGIDEWEKRRYIQDEDKFVIATRAGNVKDLKDEDDIMLLPRKIVAYALRERRFVPLDILSLRPLAEQQNLLKDLKINMDHKRMLRSLVKAHFRNREIQKQRPLVGLNQDIIQGKGSGLFILLHGVPGVGKTATAEAIAQSNNKPLFHITCGDLGIAPKDVESELKEIFRLAHLWDCILLLDEADIFLTRRDMVNLKRNALVSVFLRVLEYYNGILILTTNRVGTLDEAFKSRIHISLYYERLTRERTRAIFKVNIRKLKEIEEERKEQLKDSDLIEPQLIIDDDSIMRFAESHFDNTAEATRWNGRQIRNAFQIASSLARYDVHKSQIEGPGRDGNTSGALKGGDTQNPQPILNATQFQLVSETIARFDNYFYLATGETDEDAARRDMLRDDAARHEDLIPYQQTYDPHTPAKSRGSKGTPSRGQGGRRREEEETISRSSRGASNQPGSASQSTRKSDGGFSRRDTHASSRQEWNQKASSQRPRHGDTGKQYVYGDDDDEDEHPDEEYSTPRRYGGGRRGRA
ncbi:hypothetical protein PT974_08040 [Cladobotryum mycophilum]|uniref:AAA+ ATPase domain-containing protein n=1 Tax=Cladobotryum mycophilum TaxID=491253 RepID=A0ABR0SCS7_9HYPO